MKTRKKVLWCILALILIAWIVCAWLFIHNENKIKQNSVYCGDKLRQELWEYLENVSMPNATKLDWAYIYTWSVTSEWVNYNFSCKVYSKDNVDLDLEPVNETCEWEACEIPGTPNEEAQTYTIMWPENWFDEQLEAWQLVLRWEYEDHADVIFIDQELWQNYVDPHKMIYGDQVSFKWELDGIDWAAGTHYYNAVSIDTLEELFTANVNDKEWEKSVVEESEKVDNATVQYTPPVEEYISKSINTWKDYVQQLIDNFQWNIINWTDLESVNIEWDNTLYYNDRLWFAVILWEKWKWGRIKTKYTWREELSYKTSGGISFSKRNDNWWEYADMFWFTVFDKENYSKVESWWFWDREYFENETIWKNNKYNFVEFATNTSHDEIYDTFPTLDCKERMVQNYREIACDWYEEINWEYVKTWKSWIEQLFQDWFIFYDVK